MARPDFSKATREELSTYAMVLEMQSANLSQKIQQQGEWISSLESENSKLAETIGNLEYNMATMKQMYQNLARMVFGTKSERIRHSSDGKAKVAGEQMAFIELDDAPVSENESDANQVPADGGHATADDTQTTGEQSSSDDENNTGSNGNTVTVKSYTRQKRRTTDKIQAQLPVIEVPVQYEPGERVCPRCGNTDLVSIGDQELYTEFIVPKASVVRMKYIGERCKCPKCEGQSDQPKLCETCNAKDDDACKTCSNRPRSLFIEPKLPEHCYHPLLKGTKCSVSIMSQLLTDMIEQGLPMYRLEKEWERMGFPLPRQTMSNWFLKVDELYLEPLVKHMLATVKKDVRILHNDETHMKVLEIRTTGGKVKKCHMWVVRSGKYEKRQIVVFVFRTSRKGEEAEDILSDYTWYFVTDGYPGYNGMARIAIRCGCWDHTRRYFYNAIPNHDMSLKCAARMGVEFCDKLHMIERDLEDVTPEERLRVRLERSLPIVNEFFKWVKDLCPGNEKLKEAKNYAINQEENLRRFLEDGHIPISNNPAENAIRPMVIARKNFMFRVSIAGANATADAFSLAETAHANDLDVHAYFDYILSRMALQDGKFTDDFLDSLLPWHPDVQKACKRVQI